MEAIFEVLRTGKLVYEFVHFVISTQFIVERN